MAKLSELAQKISGALEKKKQVRTQAVHIRELEIDFTLEGLPLAKIEELVSTPLPREQQARMVVYEAAPALHSVAKELVAAGSIGDCVDMLRVFTIQEITQLMKQVFVLSGADGENRVVFSQEVENIKNA